MSGLPGQAYLEQLRPEPGWDTRYALLASYSADPIVIGYVLLALAGRARESGSGGRGDFAESVMNLRDRVRFIIQRGRMLRPANLPGVAAVLDQFIVEKPYDERKSSWHPKLALIAYEGPDKTRSWRLWIGSRNLTRSQDVDIGLLVEGSARGRKGGKAIPGIAALGQRLALAAETPTIDAENVAAELADVQWLAPEGLLVDAVDFADRGTTLGPPFDGQMDRLLLFSPFVCPGFARSLASWRKKGSRCTLVTTLSAVTGLSAKGKADLRDVELLALAPPQAEEEIASGAGLSGSEEEAPPPTSLHAKLFIGWQRKSISMVVGSANATRRAWSDRNAEAVARCVPAANIVSALEALAEAAVPIALDEMDGLPITEDATAEQLEEVRKTLACDWPVSITRKGDHFTLTAERPPELKPARMTFEIGLATGEFIPWPRGASRLDLGLVPLSLQTDFVQFRLALSDQACSWIQRLTVEPGIEANRDDAAIGRFLGCRGLTDWIRALLEGESDPSDEDWDGGEAEGGSKQAAALSFEMLTLEDMLIAWARNPAALKRADARFDANLEAVINHAEDLTEGDLAELHRLRDIWSTIRVTLLGKT